MHPSQGRFKNKSNFAGVLHLTLAPKRRKKTIKWSTDTVDNEGMGKKKSKSSQSSLYKLFACIAEIDWRY